VLKQAADFMRTIVLIKAVNTRIGEVGLESCSRYTPLVEPQQDGSVYLDISGCGPAERIVFSLADEISLQAGDLRIGWATSRLVALVAVKSSLMHSGQGRLYRVNKMERALITEVIPGCEQAFLSHLPLAQFPPLKTQELKKLTRAAFATVGDIARLPRQRLSVLLGKRAALLIRNAQGLDDTPVIGLYPPQRLTLPLNAESEELNMQQVEQQLYRAAHTLELLLGKRGAGARRVRLEVCGEQDMVRERRLSQACFEARTLANILLGLWRQFPPLKAPWQGRVVLEEIAVLNWQEQDLFALSMRERQGSNSFYLKEALQSLEMRFPGQISLGAPEAERREQVLALWDPWRFIAEDKNFFTRPEE